MAPKWTHILDIPSKITAGLNWIVFWLQMVRVSFASQIASINGTNLLAIIRLSYHHSFFYIVHSIFRFFILLQFFLSEFFCLFQAIAHFFISAIPPVLPFYVLSSIFLFPMFFHSPVSIRSFLSSCSDVMCWIWFSRNVHHIDIRHWLLILSMMSSQRLALTSVFFSLSILFLYSRLPSESK